MFIHFFADLIGPMYSFCIYLYISYVQGVTQNFLQDDVLKHSLLSQHLMSIPNLTGIHGTPYRDCQSDFPGGVQVQSPIFLSSLLTSDAYYFI